MKKRSIAILLGCFLALTLVGCGNSSGSEVITLSNTESQVEVSEIESSSNVTVYKTKNVEEYLAFLESFDESNNEILGITTCMYTGAYTNDEFYMVTFRELK